MEKQFTRFRTKLKENTEKIHKIQKNDIKITENHKKIHKNSTKSQKNTQK